MFSVKGKIINVRGRTITILRENSEKKASNLSFFYDYRNKLMKGDTIYAKFTFKRGESDKVNLEREPLVLVGSDITTIKRCLAQGLETNSSGYYYKVLIDISEQYKLSVEQYVDDLTDSVIRKRPFPYSRSKLIEPDQEKRLCRWWYYNRLLRKFNLLGITSRDIMNVDENLSQLYQRCLKNPFIVLIIPLNRCIKIFELLYKKATKSQLICAKIARILYMRLNDTNHSYLPVQFFKDAIANFDSYLSELKDDYGIEVDSVIINGEKGIYLPYPLKVERFVSKFLKKCINYKMETKLSPIEYTRNDLSNDQIKAIKGALNNSVTIITGEAGTGKTTVIKEIVTNLEKSNVKYILSSFTGKAVSRLKTVTDRTNVATLDYYINGLDHMFEYVIIDEASMVSTELFYRFFHKNNSPTRIILIGDPNQLPPITWGSFFSELNKSNIIPIYKLTQNHRSDVIGENGIIYNSQSMIKYHTEKHKDRSFLFRKFNNFRINTGDTDVVLQLVQLFKTNMGNVFNKSILKIISPYNAPLKYLNNRIRHMFTDNNNKFVKDIQGSIWHLNTVVMLTQNRNKLGIMNGDEGIIIDVDFYNSAVTVEFHNGVTAKFGTDCKKNSIGEIMNTGIRDKCTTDMLIQSYAISIHKSQGSEWEYVIIYIPKTKNENEFIDFNLLYTAVTRARKSIWFVGDEETLNSFARIKMQDRYDGLLSRMLTK
uniref:RecD helicase /ATP-dependent exoDNAse n=1 Tax=Pithovirus LCPAC001 TaxID=2506585 RepID=A0A481Z3U0_9VIRU|nr:MAG: RecD helicase /ATP-dependent exoDNAse [Pithovirus LCPAC001]